MMAPRIALVGVVAWAGHMGAQPRPRADVLKTSCWFESRAFNMMRGAVASALAKDSSGAPGAERFQFKTSDGVTLRGYRIPAAGVAPATGYVLVAQGNAMAAVDVATELQWLARAGYDVYVADYRGFMQSEGQPRLRAIIDDYRELLRDLNRRGYQRRFVYGMSLGGIVLLSATDGTEYDGLILDGVPSELPKRLFGLIGHCDDDFDPVHHLPAKADKVLVVVGLHDSAVDASAARALSDRARSSGAAVQELDVDHPLRDADRDRERRSAAVVAFVQSRK